MFSVISEKTNFLFDVLLFPFFELFVLILVHSHYFFELFIGHVPLFHISFDSLWELTLYLFVGEYFILRIKEAFKWIF